MILAKKLVLTSMMVILSTTTLIAMGLRTQAYAASAPPVQPGTSNGFPVSEESRAVATGRVLCASGSASGPHIGGSNVSQCQQNESNNQQAFVESANTPLNSAPSNSGPVQTHPPAGTPAAR